MTFQPRDKLLWGSSADKAQIRERPVRFRYPPGGGDPTAFLIDSRLQNWALLVEVKDQCADKLAAAQAARTLRKRFEDHKNDTELAVAAHIWLVLLCKAGDVFVSQCKTNEFLKSVEKVIKSPGAPRYIKVMFAKIIVTAAERFGTQYREFVNLKTFVENAAGGPQIPAYAMNDSIFFPRHSKVQQWTRKSMVDGELQPGTSAQTHKPSIRTTDEIRIPRAESSSPELPSPDHEVDLPPEIGSTTPRHEGRRSRSASPGRLIPRPPLDVDRSIAECKLAQMIADVLTDTLDNMVPDDLRPHGVLAVLGDSLLQCERWQRQVSQQIRWVVDEIPDQARVHRTPASENGHSSFLDRIEIRDGKQEFLAELYAAQKSLNTVLTTAKHLEMIGNEMERTERPNENWSRSAVLGHQHRSYATDPGPHTQPPVPPMEDVVPLIPLPAPVARPPQSLDHFIPPIPTSRIPMLPPMLPPLSTQPPLQPPFPVSQSAHFRSKSAEPTPSQDERPRTAGALGHSDAEFNGPRYPSRPLPIPPTEDQNWNARQS